MWNKVHSICLLGKIYLVIQFYLSMKNWRPASDLNSWITMSCTETWQPGEHQLPPPIHHPLFQAPTPPAITSSGMFPGFSSTFFLLSQNSCSYGYPSGLRIQTLGSSSLRRTGKVPLEEAHAGSGSGLRAIGKRNSRVTCMKNMV